MRSSRPSTSANTSASAGRSASSSPCSTGAAGRRPVFFTTSTTSRINAFSNSSSTLRRNASTSSPPPASAPPRGRTDADFLPGRHSGSGLQRGHAALRYAPDPVVHRTNAHAAVWRPASLHAAQHQFDRLPSCLQRNYGFGHTASIPGIHRQPAFRALSGRIAQHSTTCAVVIGVVRYSSTALERSSRLNIRETFRSVSKKTSAAPGFGPVDFCKRFLTNSIIDIYWFLYSIIYLYLLTPLLSKSSMTVVCWNMPLR